MAEWVGFSHAGCDSPPDKAGFLNDVFHCVERDLPYGVMFALRRVMCLQNFRDFLSLCS